MVLAFLDDYLYELSDSQGGDQLVFVCIYIQYGLEYISLILVIFYSGVK